MRMTADEGDFSFLKNAGVIPGEQERMHVRFRIEPVYDKLASEGGEVPDPENWGKTKLVEGAGRPIYREAEYITIMIPGDRENIVDREVINVPGNPMSDTVRFSKQYEMWKQTKNSTAVVGTPLTVLVTMVPPILNMAQVKEFEHWNIVTAEQMDAMPDATAGKFPGIVAIRDRVRRYLALAKEEAPAAAMRAALEKRDSEIAVLKNALEEQGKQIKKLSKGA